MKNHQVSRLDLSGGLSNVDGVVENPIYGVAAVFQTLGILHVLCLVPEKLLRLAPQGHFLRGVYGTWNDAINVDVIT